MEKIQIHYRGVDALHTQEDNPRRNEGAVDRVRASIREFGFLVPIVVDDMGNIWAGETRYKAGVAEGMEDFPCILAGQLSSEQLRAFRLADNKVAEFSGWDEEKLWAELTVINIDMSAFGFDMTEKDIAAVEAAAEKAFNYVEQYGVIVMCANEKVQEETYSALKAQGYECKVVAV